MISPRLGQARSLRRPLPALLTAACLSCASPANGTRHAPPPQNSGTEALRAWSASERRWVEGSSLLAALAGADFVLLGETHDNPLHHRLQATILSALVAAGRRPAVGFEMLDPEQQHAVDAAVARAPRDPDALAAAVGWEKSGWPPFELYRPVFQVALEAGLPIVAVNLTRGAAREAVRRGSESLPPDVQAMLERQGPLPDDVARAYREEMQESHCGELPAEMLDPMVTMQRARDAQIAARLLVAAAHRGAVLIAGSGHVRTDRGVPVFLSAEAPGRKALAVSFQEAAPGSSESAAARQLEQEAHPYDYVIPTPMVAREDPCRGFKERVRRIPTTKTSG